MKEVRKSRKKKPTSTKENSAVKPAGKKKAISRKNPVTKTVEKEKEPDITMENSAVKPVRRNRAITRKNPARKTTEEEKEPVKTENSAVKPVRRKRAITRKNPITKSAEEEKEPMTMENPEMKTKPNSTAIQTAEKKKTKCPTKLKTRPGFLTLNTTTGLKVTLRSALELLEYLTTERGYLYLMTARLNQDNLEVHNFAFYLVSS